MKNIPHHSSVFDVNKTSNMILRRMLNLLKGSRYLRRVINVRIEQVPTLGHEYPADPSIGSIRTDRWPPDASSVTDLELISSF